MIKTKLERLLELESTLKNQLKKFIPQYATYKNPHNRAAKSEAEKNMNSIIDLCRRWILTSELRLVPDPSEFYRTSDFQYEMEEYLKSIAADIDECKRNELTKN